MSGGMFTHDYNGAWIHGYCDKPECYVTSDCGTMIGSPYSSYRSAQIAITTARKGGLPPSRGTKAYAQGQL